jgi:ADP-ribose pyrophosphatase
MADDTHLIETCLSAEQVYKGNFLDVRRDTVGLPDGGSATREYIVHPGAVVVVPLLDGGRLALVRQYRYPLQQVLLEFPAGKIDPGEDTLVCGQRELAEETGYRAREWAYAGKLHNAAAYASERIEIYFARGLTLGERSLDHGELIDVHLHTAEELDEMAGRGELTDAKTLICLLWLQRWRAGDWPLDWRSVAP